MKRATLMRSALMVSMSLYCGLAVGSDRVQVRGAAPAQGQNDPPGAQPVQATARVVREWFDFDDGAGGWTAGFADHPVGEEEFYELSAGVASLPPPLQSDRGFRVSGNNHSDDLFMFIKKKLSGLTPNSRYDVQFSITFATNVPSGCAGIGGSPGESVYVKAGATAAEPAARDDGNGFYVMNIDKGNQSVGGSDAIVLGNFANSQDCESGNDAYEKKTLDSRHIPFTVMTNETGELWVLFGTDSGFEGATTIYFLEGRIMARRLR